MHIRVPVALRAASVAILTLRPGMVFAAARTIEEMQQEVESLQAASQELVNAADTGDRDLTPDEIQQINDNRIRAEAITAQITARHMVTRPTAAAPGSNRRTSAMPGVGNQPTAVAVPAQARTNPGRGGFDSMGHFAVAVRNAVLKGQIDQRLTNAAAAVSSNEGTGADGGFSVPPDFRETIMTRLFDQDSLLARCDGQQSSSNMYVAPVDETTPWGSSGIKAFWEGEAASIKQTKPTLGQITLRLNKLAALVPVTEEMLEDAPAIDGYLRSKTPEAMDYSISNAIVWGGGVGMPLGFMDSGALVVQAAENAQAADTVNATNISKMLARMPARSRATAVWIINPDAEPQLPLMSIANQPVYLPPGGLADAPLGRLLGRPVIPHQVAKSIGDLGDIMLVDLSQYLAVRKAAGVQAQTSIHLWFDQDLTAYKFTFRLAGQPWWSKPQDPANGSNTQSPFVALAAR